MAETQPSLTPDRANPKSISYRPHGGSQEWHVEKWHDLTSEFDVRVKEMPLWHKELAPTSSWTIIRLRYQIGPLYGEGFDQRALDPWTEGEIAGELGLSLATVKESIKASIDFWNRRRQEIPIQERLIKKPEHHESAPAPGPTHESTISINSMHRISPDDVNKILSEVGFSKLPNEDQRLYAARRIAELKPWFEDKKTRETARQIVNAELNLRRYEELLLEPKIKSEDFRKLEEAQTKLVEKHADLISEIGADEIETDVQKNLALDTFSSFARGMQEWYANGDRKPLDGIFPAGEVEWLLTPTEFRPPQYRPDIVVRLREALEPQNIWASDYEPTPVQRRACRALNRIVKKVAEDLYAEDKAEEELETKAPDGAPKEHEEPETTAPQKAPIPSFAGRTSHRDDDEAFMITS